jgi:hypothetical protein
MSCVNARPARAVSMAWAQARSISISAVSMRALASATVRHVN